MRSLNFQLFKLTAYFILSLVTLSCGSRKKTVDTKLEALSHSESTKTFAANRQLITSFYGDVLKGSFVADTNDIDSGTFESNGIKVKFKAKVKNGKPVIDFTAEAKPVARSSLTENQHSTNDEKQTSKIVQQTQTELKTSSWPWWYYPLILLAVLLLTLAAIKKLKTWLSKV